MQTSNMGNQQMGNQNQPMGNNMGNAPINITKQRKQPLPQQPNNQQFNQAQQQPNMGIGMNGQNQMNNQMNMNGQQAHQPFQGNNNGMWQGNMAPGSVIGTRDNVKIIDSFDFSQYGLRVEIMEYQDLLGSTNTYGAQSLWFMKEVNIKCRQIAIYMQNSGAKIEAGAMSYFQGPIDMKAGINSVGKVFKQALTSKLTNERFAMPEYTGSGILVLEPSFKHFIILQLEQGESIICDKGMFFAASLSVDIQPCFAGGISGSLLGGEGIFQQMITGPGMIILESPVPMCEINKVQMVNDTLKVDGNFALLRTGNISMNVEMASQSVIGSAVSGEGLVNVYRGSGEVWLAPTIKVYDALRVARSIGGDLAAVDFNTSTGHTKAK